MVPKNNYEFSDISPDYVIIGEHRTEENHPSPKDNIKKRRLKPSAPFLAAPVKVHYFSAVRLGATRV